MLSHRFSRMLVCAVFILAALSLFSSCSDDDNPIRSTDTSDMHAVFLSDRNGTVQPYAMKDDGSKQKRLVRDDAVYESPTWSPDGSEIVCARQEAGNWDIHVIDPSTGASVALTSHAADDQYPVWSPDGSKIAFESWRDGDREIYVIDADGSNLTRLTNHAGEDKSPSWRPDGARIAFASQDAAAGSLWKVWYVNPDGTGLMLAPAGTYPLQDRFDPVWSPQGDTLVICFSYTQVVHKGMFMIHQDSSRYSSSLITTGAWSPPPSWSADGGSLLISIENSPGNGLDIWRITFNSGIAQLTNLAGDDESARELPDGSRVVFCSSRDGNREIYIMDADGGNQTNLSNNTASDWCAHWRHMP